MYDFACHKYPGIRFEAIEAAVREAGKQMLTADVTPQDIFSKDGPVNFVTRYDVLNQQLLISRFREILPEAAFFGEEETEGAIHTEVSNGYVFYIDPIDGTTNFMFDFRHSNVSVGLMLDGKMIAGFVYQPYTDEMFTAVRGCGAYRNGKRLTIAERGLSESIAMFGAARYYTEGCYCGVPTEDVLFATIRKMYQQSLALRCGGSAAIDLCRVAASSACCYVEMHLSPYDYAAASVILEEAGGEIAQLDGNPVTFDKGCSIIGGTKTASAQVRKIVHEIVSK